MLVARWRLPFASKRERHLKRLTRRAASWFYCLVRTSSGSNVSAAASAQLLLLFTNFADNGVPVWNRSDKCAVNLIEARTKRVALHNMGLAPSITSRDLFEKDKKIPKRFYKHTRKAAWSCYILRLQYAMSLGCRISVNRLDQFVNLILVIWIWEFDLW